jgi:hypothetical protein
MDEHFKRRVLAAAARQEMMYADGLDSVPSPTNTHTRMSPLQSSPLRRSIQNEIEGDHWLRKREDHYDRCVKPSARVFTHVIKIGMIDVFNLGCQL